MEKIVVETYFDDKSHRHRKRLKLVESTFVGELIKDYGTPMEKPSEITSLSISNEEWDSYPYFIHKNGKEYHKSTINGWYVYLAEADKPEWLNGEENKDYMIHHPPDSTEKGAFGKMFDKVWNNLFN